MRRLIAWAAVGLAAAALGADALGVGAQSGLGTQQTAALVAGLAGALWLARERFGDGALVVALVTGLAVATVFVQYRGLAHVVPGLDADAYLEEWQLPLHRSVLAGEGGDPWQYRVLSEWGAELSYDAARELGAGRPEKTGFLAFRVVQNLAIFWLAWLLLRRLRLSRSASALGLGLIAGAMTQALHDTGLAFNTYTDVALYLGAGVALLDRRWGWIVPLAALAALNRETGALIPVMALAVAAAEGSRSPAGRRGLAFGGAALLAFAAVALTVRGIVGPGDLIEPHGKRAGTQLLYFNLERSITWEYLFRTLNVVPFVALAGIARWPRDLRLIGLTVVPLWFAIHAFMAVLAETRLLLVPYALVLVPGALLALPEARDPPVPRAAARRTRDDPA